MSKILHVGLIVAGLLLCSVSVVAQQWGVRIDAYTNNIPSTFTLDDAGSEILDCKVPGAGTILNGTDSDISLGFGTNAAAASDVYAIIPSDAVLNFDVKVPNSVLYIKGTDGSVAPSTKKYVYASCGPFLD